MSKDTDNSYIDILRSSGPSKTGCPTCDTRKLLKCACKKSGSEENESEEKFSSPKESPIFVLVGPQEEFQFALKPNVKLTDIKALLEQFIIELTRNVDIDVKELGNNLDTYYDDTQENILATTINHPEHFVEFCNRLRDQELIEIKQEQAQEIENITHQEDCQSFNPSPFKMTLTPFEDF